MNLQIGKYYKVWVDNNVYSPVLFDGINFVNNISMWVTEIYFPTKWELIPSQN